MKQKAIQLILALILIPLSSHGQDVIWNDDFSSPNFKDNYDMNHPQNFTHIPGGGPDKNGCVEVTVIKGDHYGGSMRWMIKEHLGYEPEELYAEYQVKYDKSMSPAIANYGGKGPGFSGTYDDAGWGNRPGYGVNGWSARGHVSCKANYVANGYYVYHTYTNYDAPYVAGTTDYRNKRPVEYDVSNPGAQPHADTDTWGSGMSWKDGGNMDYDTWYKVKQYVKLNDIGVNNGILKTWVNGELVCNYTDINFRSVEKLKIYCYWFNYYNGGSDVADENATVQLDNFKLYLEEAPPVRVEGVIVTPAEETVEAYSEIKMSATVSPEEATIKTVSWTSSNNDVATIDQKGIVRGVSEGTAQVIATTSDGGFKDTCIINVTPFPVDSAGNLAFMKPVTGSASDSNTPSGAIDGNPTTRWSAEGFPQWIEVDLGEIQNINKTQVVCYLNRAYTFMVEAKANETDAYTQVVDRSSNTTPGTIDAPITDEFDTFAARYVKLSVLGAGAAYSGSWASITEFKVYADIASHLWSSSITKSAQIYPNPFSTHIRVQLEGKQFSEARISDLSGKTISLYPINGITDVLINPSYNEMPKGTYILQLVGQEQNESVLIKRE